MSYINTTAPDQATGQVSDMYRQLQGSMNYLPNYASLYCHRPLVMDAWAALQSELKRHLDDRAYALICLGAARATGSSYCSLAFGKRLLRGHLTARQLQTLIETGDDSALQAGEAAMFRIAGKVARDATSVTEADIQALRDAGFEDAAIFDVVVAAAGRCFFARVPDALGALPDPSYNKIPSPLRELLVVGRAIESESRPVTAAPGVNHKQG